MTQVTVPDVEVDPMLLPRVHTVVEMIDEIPDVVTIRAVPTQGAPPAFLPAQVSMVGAFGIGEAAISISSSSAQTEYHDYTIRRAGAITSALTSMRPGDEFWTRGPFGAAWHLDHPDADIVLVAGGIGLAPLRSAVYHVLDHRDVFRSATLVVGARRPEDLLYRAEYEAWRRRGLDVIETIDQATPGWDGATGFVPSVVAGLELDGDRTAALLCGPDVMMQLTTRTLADRGVPLDRIQLTLERNMQCGTGRCGHCQLGPLLVCRDGPVVRATALGDALAVREL
jgi:NAD(P)H-flavin reductase